MSIVVALRMLVDSRLDGGCAAEDGRSSSSLARLLRLLLGPAPRFAEDMLGRSGELSVVRKWNRR